ncbi:DUF732 domain-containing protein [Cellulomonas aerilata]|uniref:DUF732 domain-containing protein n=1 Tax=Cellulomonas aerilata TaxID=515326 RepID=A0A512D9E1_9CELL|nr:DUF732 domain-containing protein [Cellulomonas aerilata]GEO33079.1 hypothetical protein CAE01nite_08040 [Cellulomonas aerilata]
MTRTTRTALAGTAGVLLALLTACGGAEPTAAEEPAAAAVAVEEKATEKEPEPTTEPTPEPAETEGPDAQAVAAELPTRATMTAEQGMVAAGVFLEGVAEIPVLASVDQDSRIAAGYAACDAMDTGKDIKGLMYDVILEAPTAGDLMDIASLVGIASGSLCPEHAGSMGS